jgi:uncharacterized protein YndB with AHSA1/START domain
MDRGHAQPRAALSSGCEVMDFTVTVLTDAKPGTVFAALTDVLHWPEFVPGVTAVEMRTEGDLRPGAQFIEVRKRFGFEQSEELLVVDMLPAERLVLVNDRPALARVRRDFAIAFTGNDTELSVTQSVEPRGFLGRLLKPFSRLASPRIEQRLEQDLMAIKLEAERRSS